MAGTGRGFGRIYGFGFAFGDPGLISVFCELAISFYYYMALLVG
jgi:hypothetical protein